MKIRTGFVSNSSSSSFVAAKGIPFDCPIEAAHHMLMERKWPDDSAVIKELVTLTRTKKIDATSNLCFPSTNYDTYIYNTENGLGIYTCNNINWDFPPGVVSDPEDAGYNATEDLEFTMVNTGVRGIRVNAVWKEITDDIPHAQLPGLQASCNTCYTGLWVCEWPLTGRLVMCPKCQTAFYKKLGTQPWQVV